MGEDRIVASDGLPRRWRWAALWVLPPLCLLALLFVAPKIPETYKAWRGHGEAGSLLVDRVEYGKRCRYFGTWTSNDHSRVLPNAWVDDLNRDDCRYEARDEIAALYVGNAETVYVEGDYAFWFAVVISGGSLLYLLGLSAFLGRTLRRKRSAVHSLTTPD